jgi:metallo-beta-lactamase class B
MSLKYIFPLCYLAFAVGCVKTDYNLSLDTDNLKINRVMDQVYIHESYLETDDFGKVSCNGLIYVNRGEAIIFDTPPDVQYSNILISWLSDSFRINIKAIIPTHSHSDCLGGLAAFHQQKIPSISNQLTILLASKGNLEVPQKSFINDTILEVGDKQVIVSYPGEGHTVDNVVGYIPSEEVLFGGCLVKSLGAGKGFTGDANTVQWPNTIRNIKVKYPKLKTVIPGHGDFGDQCLLDYTIQLFED